MGDDDQRNRAARELTAAGCGRVGVTLIHRDDDRRVVVLEPARREHRCEVGARPVVTLKHGPVMHVVHQVWRDPYEIGRVGGVEGGDQGARPRVGHVMAGATVAQHIVEVQERVVLLRVQPRRAVEVTRRRHGLHVRGPGDVRGAELAAERWCAVGTAGWGRAVSDHVLNRAGEEPDVVRRRRVIDAVPGGAACI